MRICHIITTISRGGAENQLLILAELQVAQGDKVTVLPLKGSLDLLETFVRIGAEVDLSLYGKRFINQVRICNFSGLLNFDIIHCHLPQPELLLAFNLKKKPVITRHFGGAFYPNRNKFLSSTLSRFASWRSKAVIAISESVSEYLRLSKEIASKVPVYTVEYGFNSSSFVGGGQVKKPQFQTRANNLHFGTLARLSVEKDLKTFIRAASLLTGQPDSNYQFKIFGEGPLRRELEQIISDLGVRNEVQLCGRTMDPAQILTTFDVFVLTSRFEGFGMVLLEAMSVGLPIICSKIPTSVEILGETGAAVFFEPGNAVDLSEKMRRISEHLDSGFQLEQAKRLELYSSKVMLAKINQVYQRICRE